MSRLARTCVRLLDLKPDAAVAIDLLDAGLAAAARSLAESSGATTPDDGPVSAGLIDLEVAPAPLVADRAKRLIARVVTGGAVVVVIHQPDDEHHNALAARVGPSLGVANAQAEREGPALILWGRRVATPSKARIKELRGLGHALEASVLVGRPGLTPELVASARAALERHGLVKVKLTPQCELDKQQTADDIAWATGAVLVQRIGKTALLYRPDVKLVPPVSHRRGGGQR